MDLSLLSSQMIAEIEMVGLAVTSGQSRALR
jgi:hypothetical protein